MSTLYLLRNVGWGQEGGSLGKKGQEAGEERVRSGIQKVRQEQGDTENNFATFVIFCNRNGTKRMREPLRKWAGCGS